MASKLASFAERVRVLDGGWGTQLQGLGLPPGSPPEIWNAASPAAVEKVARSYVGAGADAILTNTFGANRFVLANHGAEARAAELAEAGARISRQAAGGTAMVFGSVGPTGKVVMMGEVAEEELTAAFAEVVEGLDFGGCDAIVLETFNELAELEIALQAARKVSDLPVVASMTFASGPDKTATMMGNRPEDLAAAAEKLGADGVGANCGAGPEGFVPVAHKLRAATDLPVWVKANAGLPQVVNRETVFPMGPEEFGGFVPRLVEAGANFIGGCCGTTPDHIRAVRSAVDALE